MQPSRIAHLALSVVQSLSLWFFTVSEGPVAPPQGCTVEVQAPECPECVCQCQEHYGRVLIILCAASTCFSAWSAFSRRQEPIAQQPAAATAQNKPPRRPKLANKPPRRQPCMVTR